MERKPLKVILSDGIKGRRPGFRRILKQWVGAALLNPWYRLCCLLPVEENLVVLADGHQNRMPYSMTVLFRELKKHPDVKVATYFRDYSFCGALEGLCIMLRFMPLYARARYVFLSDCYIPVSCCKKRRETTVVQLWHSCGLMKQVGADSGVEKRSMSPWQYRNYDVFTTSAPCVSDILARAMDIPRHIFSEAGVSRMDALLDERRVKQLRADFFRRYPQYRGKRIVLWAPTFRGSARNGFLVGQEEILRLQRELPESYALIIKTHRFARSKDMDTPVAYGAEELLAVADILITDYSSIYFDYLYFRRPIILFAPDLQAYQAAVGLYRPYESMPGRRVQNGGQLRRAVLTAQTWADEAYVKQLDALWAEQMAYCDGRSTEKLLAQIGLLPRQQTVE